MAMRGQTKNIEFGGSRQRDVTRWLSFPGAKVSPGDSMSARLCGVFFFGRSTAWNDLHAAYREAGFLSCWSMTFAISGKKRGGRARGDVDPWQPADSRLGRAILS